jgi:hypothetical protein
MLLLLSNASHGIVGSSGDEESVSGDVARGELGRRRERESKKIGRD